MATIREYTIKVNPVLGLVDAPKKMYFYRSDVETSSLKIVSTSELPNATVSLTCIKKSTNSIVTMTGTVDPLNNVNFTLLLLSQFTSTSDTLNCELKITQDGTKVTTFPNFNIIVNPSIVDGIEGGQDPTEETTLSNLIDEVNDILNQLNNGGVDGRGITSITKTGTNGLVDTYTIVYTDNTTSTFTVTNGANGNDGVGIKSVTKTSTEGLVDTYTITLTNNTTTTFTVTNGKDGRGITDISKTSTDGLVDTYTITYTDNTTSTFTVTNGADGGGGGGTGTDGRGIVSITKTDTEGLVDTYTITYTDNTTSTFSVTNGADGQKGADGRGITSITKTKTEGLVDTYTINYTDNTTSEFSVTNGADGGGGGGGSTDVPLIAKGYFDYTNDFKNTSKFTAQVRSQNTKALTNLPDGNTTSRQAVVSEYTGDLLALWKKSKKFYLVGSFISNNGASHSSVGTKDKIRPLWIKLEYRIVIQNSDGEYSLKGNASNPSSADTGYFETAILPKQQTIKDSSAGYSFTLVLDNTDNNINLMGAPIINNLKGTSSSASYDFHNHEFITFGGLKPIISELPYSTSVSYVGIVPYKLTCYFYEEGETEVADVSNTNKTKLEMFTEVTA